MTSKESKIFVFRLGRKWIWIFFAILTLGLIYATYNAYYTVSDDENVYDDNQEQIQSNPTRTISPFYEILFIIQRTGADFNPNVVNDYEKFESYSISSKKAAINLGVYAMDIGYLSIYGRTQQALNYMDVCLELNKTVCGQDVNNFDVLERFEKNLSNPDSLIQILIQFNIKVITYLDENEHRDFGVLMLAGAFIEALYITTQIIDTYPKNLLPNKMRMQVLSPLVSILLDQKGFLMSLIELLENVDGKGDLELTILIDLKELYYIYDNYPKYKFYPHPQEPITDRMFLLLLEQIGNIRADVIS